MFLEFEQQAQTCRFLVQLVNGQGLAVDTAPRSFIYGNLYDRMWQLSGLFMVYVEHGSVADFSTASKIKIVSGFAAWAGCKFEIDAVLVAPTQYLVP